MAASERYTIITADSHAGGSHAQYREYLDPRYHEEFDAWRGKYKNPYKDLGDTRRYRNWDNEMRVSQQQEDGVVGEVVFPNTIPPFFPSFVLFAGPAKPGKDYELRLEGIRTHNRWLVDWCADYADERAGIGQIFVNNLEDAMEDARWIKEHGLRGGILLPNIPPDAHWVEHHLFDPYWEPLWALCEDLEIPVNAHGGTGVPDFGKVPAAQLLYITEAGFYSQRPFIHLLLSGVFERHPRLKFVMTEQGAAWIPPLLKRMDSTLERIRKTGATGEIRYGEDSILPKSATEYFQQNCYVGISQPRPADVAAIDELGIDRFMWGSDYPHDEGTHPYTREHLRQLFWNRDEQWMRQFLAGNAAELYDFDLKALEPLAAKYGPTVEEIAQPLLELPDEPNEALLAGAVAGFKE
jgi:predicted TIM-barrel fold metal-dependent hydrolase